jgi:hypothetical protein
LHFTVLVTGNLVIVHDQVGDPQMFVMPALWFLALGPHFTRPMQVGGARTSQACFFLQLPHGRGFVCFACGDAASGQVVQQAWVGGFVVGSSTTPQVPIRAKTMDVNRVAFHAQMAKSRSFHAKPRRDDGVEWAKRLGPKTEKFMPPTGQATMGAFLFQKSLKLLAALQMGLCGCLPQHTSFGDLAAR